jgi:peptidylglycine monooxygenase
MGTDLVVGLGEQLYAVHRPWGDRHLRVVSDVAVDSQDNVYVFQRTDPPVVVFAPDGTFLRSWGSGVLADAHGIFIDHEDRVWLADRDAHQILAFDAHGNLLLTLGERHHPHFQTPFNHPADVAVAPNGDIYVADGYANSVIHRFSADGQHQQTWGGPATFTTPHAIRVLSDGRVIVADRENNRLQLFSATGAFDAVWSDVYHPMDLFVDANDNVYVTDQIPRLTKFTKDGTLVGRCRPVLFGAHGIWIDSRGDIYLAETAPMDRLTKLVRC